MKANSFTTILLFLFSIPFLSAQEVISKWSSPEIFVQNRSLHQTQNSILNFTTTIDLGIGLRWDVQISNKSSLILGGALNYGSFNSDLENPENNELFISFFKKADIHYFIHESVDQFTLEIPILYQFKLAQFNQNTLSLNGGVNPQLRLFSEHRGFRFGQDTVVREFPHSGFSIINKTPFISDVYINTGLSFDIRNKISLNAGIEYSTFGKSFGLYSKLGFRF